MRRAADNELIGTRLAPPRLAWRTQELTSTEHRLALGGELAELVHAAATRLLPGASPIDRVAVRDSRAEVLALASRLCDLDRPVQPRGVLLTEQLLGNPRGPLYGRGNLARDAGRALEALGR
jgi:hypothetical protein